MSDKETRDKRGPRGSKAQVEAVKKNAAAAGEQLDREQEESVGHLASALAEISEGEALAHLDTRLSFLERQVERLTTRREDADRGVQGELSVMRARIDDALEAVGAMAQEQKESLTDLEKRAGAMVLDSERRSAGVAETLRRELVGRVQEALTRLERYEARLRGEMKAFEEGADEQARSLLESFAESREQIESSLESVTEDLTARMDASAASVSTELESETSALRRSLEEMQSGMDSRQEQVTQEIEKSVVDRQKRIEEVAAQVEERAGGLESSIEDHLRTAAARLQEKVEALNAELDSRLDTQSREFEGRFSEWLAEVRLETQKLREMVESQGVSHVEALDQARRDLLMQIRGAEEKVASAAIRSESMFGQQRKQLTAVEQEWDEALKGLTESLSELTVRVEELGGRLANAETRAATERGSAGASVERMSARFEVLEQRVREAVEEVNAEHATKIEMLGTQVASFNTSEVAAEERLGAVDYLKRRVAEMAERLDEIVVKVNAIGRYVTKPGVAARVAGAAPADELSARLDAIEKSISQLAERVPPSQPEGAPPKLEERLAALEASVATLAAAILKRPVPPTGEVEVTSTLRQLESHGPHTPTKSAAPPAAQTILPEKKHRWP